MKHTLHKNRKSFRKWALPNQRFHADTSFGHIKATASTKGAFGMKVKQFAARIFAVLARREAEAQPTPQPVAA